MNAKESFIESGFSKAWENITETIVFRVAVSHALLKMAQDVGSHEPLEFQTAKIIGAKELIRNLEMLHIKPQKMEQAALRTNLNHEV